MSSIKIRNFYIRDIKNKVGASPIWPISANYSLGDYGYYIKRTGRFHVRGNIFDDLAVPRDGVVVPAPIKPVRLYKVFNSSNAVKNEFSLNGEGAAAKGSLSLVFEGNKSYFFQLFRAEVTHLKLNEEVRQRLIQARREGRWHHRYRIIEQLYTCPDVRFQFSISKNAQIELSGNVEKGEIVRKAAVNYGLKSSSNMDGSFWIENAAATPFVGLASFKRRELRFYDEKFLLSEAWELAFDNTSSFDADVEEFLLESDAQLPA
ncbi:MAG: hypothetical protein AAF433_06135 [Bacteroidota bacterium]